MSACYLKSLLIGLIETILKNYFKKAIRSDSPYTEDEKLTSLQIVTEKKAPSGVSCKKDQLSEKKQNPTPHDVAIKKNYHGKVYV